MSRVLACIGFAACTPAPTTRPPPSVFAPELDRCVTAALARHHWNGLHDVVITIPIRFSGGG